MIQYIPYVLLFALATAILYTWGLWRSMRQKQDLSNMLSAKGISAIKKSAEKKRPSYEKRAGAVCERPDCPPAFFQGTDRCDRTGQIPRFYSAIHDPAENDPGREKR